MNFRRIFMVTVSSLAVLSTALLAGCGSSTTEAPQTSAEEIVTADTEIPAAEGTSLSESGVLILSVNPEIQIDYDENGIVTAITGRNEDGKKSPLPVRMSLARNVMKF